MTDAPDFPALRAKRDKAILEAVKSAWIEFGGDPAQEPAFHSHSYGGCYCACPDGPCEHQWGGWRKFECPDGGGGGEQVCKLCGMGAMSHSLRCAE